MLSTHRMPSLSFILYIHDLIDSLLFEILYANEENKTQNLKKFFTRLGFGLECF